MQPFR